jgi:hypothetical protein
MALFKMIRDALPPAVVERALPLVADLASRTGGKFSFVSNEGRPDERVRLLSIVESFLDGPVAELFRGVHGVEPSVCLSMTTVRLQRAHSAEQLVDWHLDLNFIGDGKPFLVAWTAIEDVGVDRVAIDICVPASKSFDLTSILTDRVHREKAGRAMAFSDNELDQLLGEGAWTCRPVVAAAGTAAVFDQYILHRSQVLPTASKDCHSIEFRMMDIDRLPAQQRIQPALYARRSGDDGLELFIQRRETRSRISVEDFKTLRIV